MFIAYFTINATNYIVRIHVYRLEAKKRLDTFLLQKNSSVD